MPIDKIGNVLFSGPASLAGVGLMVCLIPINTAFMTKMRAFTAKQMRVKDERLKNITEILSGIKVYIF